LCIDSQPSKTHIHGSINQSLTCICVRSTISIFFSIDRKLLRYRFLNTKLKQTVFFFFNTSIITIHLITHTKKNDKQNKEKHNNNNLRQCKLQQSMVNLNQQRINNLNNIHNNNIIRILDPFPRITIPIFRLQHPTKIRRFRSATTLDGDNNQSSCSWLV